MPEKTKGFIIDPTTGASANIDTEMLTAEQARVFREYKKVLHALGLKEALYCDRCWEHNLSHGTEAHVTTDKIFIRCRCRMLIFNGPTY